MRCAVIIDGVAVLVYSPGDALCHGSVQKVGDISIDFCFGHGEGHAEVINGIRALLSFVSVLLLGNVPSPQAQNDGSGRDIHLLEAVLHLDVLMGPKWACDKKRW